MMTPAGALDATSVHERRNTSRTAAPIVSLSDEELFNAIARGAFTGCTRIHS